MCKVKIHLFELSAVFEFVSADADRPVVRGRIIFSSRLDWSLPGAASRPPSALAMVSAFMLCLRRLGNGGRTRIVGWNGPLGARPFGQHREEAGHVRRDLPGVLAAQLATEARPPDLTGAPDQIIIEIVLGVRWFHRRPHGRLLAAPCSWPPVSDSHR